MDDKTLIKRKVRNIMFGVKDGSTPDRESSDPL